MRSSFGSCVLTSVEGLQNLVQYFQLNSCNRSNIPFELKGVTCTVHNASGQVPTNSSKYPATEISASRQQKHAKLKRQNESPEQGEARLAKQRA